MNPSIQPLKNGLGFRLIPAPSSTMNQQLSSTTSNPESNANLRQKILCKNKSLQPSGRGVGSRGKRGHALKFHNFVANDCHLNGSVHNPDQPTFCLREEHGTKQITVSHWKTSHDGVSQDSPEEVDDVVVKSSVKVKKDTQSSDEEKQKSILESLLATRMLNQNHVSMDEDGTTLPKRKRSKRKPSIVRRVIHDSDEDTKCHGKPIGIYGDLMQTRNSEAISNDVQDEPLDLSSKKKKMKFEDSSHFQCGNKLVGRRSHSHMIQTSSRDPIEHLIQAVGESAARAASIMASVSSDHPSTYTNSGVVSQPSNYGNSMNERSQGAFHLSHPSSSKGSNFNGQFSSDSTRIANADSCSSADQERLLQKQSTQRNVIKQKLEDAFKTNGFLVKTKQVSDGEATFCKFRQLRKYTRYYLKSWHKHLPEEVNKLYKGFLPPSSSSKMNGNCTNDPD